MDGIHDLGGMEGFGAIDTDAPPFRHDWERRMWAIAKNTGAPDWTLDWWRHMVERMQPATYLSVSYFEKWCLNYLTGFVTSGLFTLEDVARGTTPRTQAPPDPSGVDGALQRLRDNERFFDLDSPDPARFAAGAPVRTKSHIAARHTRLPRYARGCRGEVIAHHGAHVFPDLSAQGIHVGQHLYTVAFAARDLWGEAADPRDSVTLDLWDSYLDPA